MMAGEARADLIVRNAKISTLRLGLADAEALAVEGETFLAVGTEAAVMRLADRGTQVIDAGGRRVIPGLNDSHMHAIRGGLRYNLEVRWDGPYTTGSAWFSGEETVKGTIAPDQYADFAVLSADYLTVPDDQIPCIQSFLTVTGGDVVYSAPPFTSFDPPPLRPPYPEWSPVGIFGGYQQERS